MKPKVTVVTCVYNGLPYLKEAIESTLSQTYTDFEYLIIDDCSTDQEVVKFIETYNDPRIRFVKNNQNLGIANTFNKALSIINTPYVVRIDQDDVNLQNRFEDQISYLEKHKDIDIVCSWEYGIDSNGKKLRYWKRVLDNYGAFLGYVLMGICPIWHPSIAFRTKAMKDVGCFNPEYTRAEDFEVTTRMALKRLNAAIVPQFLVQVREHDNRQSVLYSNEMQNFAKIIHKNALQFFINHELISEFASFLRIDDIPGIKRDKKHLIEYSKILERLFEKVKTKQNLTFEEMKTFRKTFVKRLGYGIIFCQYFAFLPKVLFYLCFNILSPLSNPSIRKPIVKLYSRLSHLRVKI